MSSTSILRVITALLPAQGPALARALTYELDVDGDGTFRVELGAGVARVEPQPPATPPDPDVELRVAGPPSALAPLVAGGAGRRLRGARVSGRKRRLRPLLKARRKPVTLAELAVLGLPLEPGLLLRALTSLIDPAWTAGERFTVVYDVAGAPPAAHRVEVADGAPVVATQGVPPEPAAATVSLARGAFVSLLARVAPPPGERVVVHGDLRAVELLHRWTDRVQGIPEAD